MIGFLAKRQSGKDTACDYLVERYGYTKRAFAHPLKKVAQELFGFTDDQIFTEQKEEVDQNWGISPRQAFQVIGSDIVRDLFPKLLLPNIGKNFWINRADIGIKDIPNQKIVWSDVRFQNEVDYILNNGGIVVKINRPSIHNNEKSDQHQSELCIDKIDNYTTEIINDGNIEDFYRKIDILLDQKI